MAANIRWYYVYAALSALRLDGAIWILYFQERGLSLFEVAIAEVFFHLSIFIGEIPTGSIADLWGRKKSMVIGSVLAAFTAFGAVFGSNVVFVYVLFFLWGLSGTFQSGANRSLLYDSCQAAGLIDEFSAILGRVIAIEVAASSLAVFLGGIIASFSYTAVYVVRAAVLLLSVGAIAMMKEPEIWSQDEPRPGILRQVRESLSLVRHNPVILRLVAYGVLFWSTATLMHLYGQVLFRSEGLGLAIAGAVFAAGDGIAALTSALSQRFQAWFGARLILAATAAASAVLILGMASLPVAGSALLFIVHLALEGIVDPAWSDLLNRQIPSTKRATVLSLSSAAQSGLIMTGFPLMGWIIQETTARTSYSLLAIAAALTLWPLALSLGRNVAKDSRGDLPR